MKQGRRTKKSILHLLSKYPSKIPSFKEKFSSQSGLPNDNELASKADDVKAVQTIAITGDYSENFSQFDAPIQSMMEISRNLVLGGTHKAHNCKVCGREGMKNDIKKHIESNHVEGLANPCNYCEKTCR